MIQTTKKLNQEVYQCEECGMQYLEKEWAEKCEAWCKEHKSCNMEIISHAVPQDDEPKKDGQFGTELTAEGLKTEDIKFLTKLFYWLIGIASSLAFFLILYWVLRLDSAITNVITNTYSTPLYFWPYVILTLGAIVLFGVNISLLVYRWRKFGFVLRSFSEGGTASGFGSIVSIAASACPVCGSTLLSAIGISGGLAAFPLGGLELKALSFGFLVLPLWLIRKDLKKLECGDDTCPVPKDHRFKESDRPWLFALVAMVIALSLISWNWLKTEPIIAKALVNNSIINPNDNQPNSANVSSSGNPLFDEVTTKVIPEKGFQSRIALNNSIVGLVENSVIDREKFLAIYKDRGDLPLELKDVLDKPLTKPILLTRKNANYYVNLLWPLGLANYMESNKKSPVNGKSLFNFASTGGWNLGKEENGGAYFNKFKIIELTPEQEVLATKIAENTYRPCCNNSTFFQDCNHGSALLGLLELGAAQGLTENELYREALAFNSFWFSNNYIQTALYFKAVKGVDWENVDPKEIMGFDYSAIGPWSKNVQAELAKIPDLIPQNKGGASCGT